MMGRPTSKAGRVPCAAHKADAGQPCSVNEKGRRYYCPARRKAAGLAPYPRGPSGPSGKRPPGRPAARWTSRRARARIAAYIVEALAPDQQAEYAARERTDPIFAAVVAELRARIAAQEATAQAAEGES